MQHISKKHRCFVVEIVASDKNVVAPFERNPVENMSFGHTTCGTGGTAGGPAAVGHVVTVFLDDVDHRQFQIPLGSKCLSEFTGRIAVVVDTKPDIQAVGLVTQVVQYVPYGQAVLATAHGNKDLVAWFTHVKFANSLLDLLMTEPKEVFAAEVGVMTLQIDDRRTTTDTTLHPAPPEMTLRISTTASS